MYGNFLSMSERSQTSVLSPRDTSCCTEFHIHHTQPFSIVMDVSNTGSEFTATSGHDTVPETSGISSQLSLPHIPVVGTSASESPLGVPHPTGLATGPTAQGRRDSPWRPRWPCKTSKPAHRIAICGKEEERSSPRWRSSRSGIRSHATSPSFTVSAMDVDNSPTATLYQESVGGLAEGTRQCQVAVHLRRSKRRRLNSRMLGSHGARPGH